MTIIIREAEGHELQDDPDWGGKVLVFARSEWNPSLVLTWPEFAELAAAVAGFVADQCKKT